MPEPLTDEELAELRLAVEMDTEFTSRMEPGASEGPAITHHLLYVTRKYGPRLLASIEALSADYEAITEVNVRLAREVLAADATAARMKKGLKRITGEPRLGLHDCRMIAYHALAPQEPTP